jgi:hypothetical protein
VKEVLLLFAKAPRPGRVKTRLIPRLGPEGAARTYRRLAARAAGEARAVARPGLVRIAAIDPPEALGDAHGWLGDGFAFEAQDPGDLGDRLASAFAAAFAAGARRVVVIGTDCPDLTAGGIDRAFRLLDDSEAVLGPAEDGGYYLLGLARPLSEAFAGVPWSTERTAAVTAERIRAAGARISCLPVLRDVDTPEDLDALAGRWQHLWG